VPFKNPDANLAVKVAEAAEAKAKAEYEKTVSAIKTKLIAQLEIAQAKATKSNDLDEAISLRAKIAQLKDEIEASQPAKADRGSGGSKPVDPRTVVIAILDADGKSVEKAQVYFIYENGTHVEALSDKQGNASIKPPDDAPATIFVAHPMHQGVMVAYVKPKKDMSVRFGPPPRTPKDSKVEPVIPGSVVDPGGWVSIPGLEGGLDLIHDSSDRTYVYGKNLSFENGTKQPFPFILDKPFVVEDKNRIKIRVIVNAVVGDVFLISYAKIPN
jgi:hypothetical protein